MNEILFIEKQEGIIFLISPTKMNGSVPEGKDQALYSHEMKGAVLSLQKNNVFFPPLLKERSKIHFIYNRGGLFFSLFSNRGAKFFSPREETRRFSSSSSKTEYISRYSKGKHVEQFT